MKPSDINTAQSIHSGDAPTALTQTASPIKKDSYI